MRKIFLTLVAFSAFCGLGIAQTAYWNDIDYTQYGNHDPLVAMMTLDNHLIDPSDNYANYEVAAFVGDYYRGHGFMKHYDMYGDPYPVLEFEIFYQPIDGNPYEPSAPSEGPLSVSFKLYDHNTNTLYDIWTCSMTIETQTAYNSYDFDSTMPTLNFFSPFTKEIQPYSGDGGYYLIASPIGQVAPANVGGMLDNSYDLYYFDQSQDKEWRNYEASNFELEPGKGYLYANNTLTNLTFSALAYSTDDYTVYLDKDDDAYWAGMNLVGNPFGETAHIVDGRSFYVMNSDGDVLIEKLENDIEPMQGIFVEATSDHEPMVFTTAPTSKGAALALNLSQGRGVIDRAIVRFNNVNNLTKFQLFEGKTKLYIPQNGKDYSSVQSEDQGVLPLNFKAAENGVYTISFNAEGVTMGYLHLIDNLTGNDVDLLATPSYSFEASKSDYESRFKLVFATGNAEDNNFGFFSNGSLIINNVGNATLQVIDVTGRVISSENINGCYRMDMDAAAGVYTLRLINGNDVKTQKIILK